MTMETAPTQMAGSQSVRTCVLLTPGSHTTMRFFEKYLNAKQIQTRHDLTFHDLCFQIVDVEPAIRNYPPRVISDRWWNVNLQVKCV